jgi:hypothetical protein
MRCWFKDDYEDEYGDWWSSWDVEEDDDVVTCDDGRWLIKLILKNIRNCVTKYSTIFHQKKKYSTIYRVVN